MSVEVCGAIGGVIFLAILIVVAIYDIKEAFKSNKKNAFKSRKRR